MPQTLKQLQSRKRKLVRELDRVMMDIQKIQDFANCSKLRQKLERVMNMIPTEELEREWPEWIRKRFAGGLFRVRYANGAYSLYGKTKTGILWQHIHRGGRGFWEKVDGQ